jgi:hypothetical protein
MVSHQRQQSATRLSWATCSLSLFECIRSLNIKICLRAQRHACTISCCCRSQPATRSSLNPPQHSVCNAFLCYYAGAGATASAVKGSQPHSTSSALNKGKAPVPGVSWCSSNLPRVIAGFYISDCYCVHVGILQPPTGASHSMCCCYSERRCNVIGSAC